MNLSVSSLKMNTISILANSLGNTASWGLEKDFVSPQGLVSSLAGSHSVVFSSRKVVEEATVPLPPPMLQQQT